MDETGQPRLDCRPAGRSAAHHGLRLHAGRRGSRGPAVAGLVVGRRPHAHHRPDRCRGVGSDDRRRAGAALPRLGRWIWAVQPQAATSNGYGSMADPMTAYPNGLAGQFDGMTLGWNSKWSWVPTASPVSPT